MLFPALKNERPRARKCQFTLSRPVTFFPPGNFSSCHSRGGQKSENFRARFFPLQNSCFEGYKSVSSVEGQFTVWMLLSSFIFLSFLDVSNDDKWVKRKLRWEECGWDCFERLELSRERYGWGKKRLFADGQGKKQRRLMFLDIRINR